MPSVVYGPGGKWIAHQADEFVEVADLVAHADVYVEAADRFLRPRRAPSVPAGAGPRNDITDVAGVAVGHHQRARARLADRARPSCSRRRAPSAASTSAAAGPGTRETDLLDPVNMVEHVDAICLTGGSAYGLAAAGGVMAWLERAAAAGFQIGTEPHHVVPIVPAAVLFDLGAGGDFAQPPGRRRSARARPPRRATRPRAPGHRRRRHRRPRRARSRAASARPASCSDSGITVAALVVAQLRRQPGRPGDRRAVGRPLRAAPASSPRCAGRRRADAAPRSGDLPWPPIRPLEHDAGRRRHRRRADQGGVHAASPAPATTAWPGRSARSTPTPTATSCSRWPPARRPCPTAPTDGFIRPAVARFTQLAPIIAAAADVVARAVVHAVLHATSAGTMRSYADQLPSAIR